MGWLPKSFWSKAGEYAKFALEVYAASQRGSSQPVAPPQPVQPPFPPPPIAVTNQTPVPLTLEQRFSDRLDAVYMEEWGRIIGNVTTADATERYQGYKLLEAGREDELRKNLRERK